MVNRYNLSHPLEPVIGQHALLHGWMPGWMIGWMIGWNPLRQGEEFIRA